MRKQLEHNNNKIINIGDDKITLLAKYIKTRVLKNGAWPTSSDVININGAELQQYLVFSVSNILKWFTDNYSDIKDWYDYVTSDGELSEEQVKALGDDDKLNDDNHYLTKSHCATIELDQLNLWQAEKDSHPDNNSGIGARQYLFTNKATRPNSNETGLCSSDWLSHHPGDNRYFRSVLKQDSIVKLDNVGTATYRKLELNKLKKLLNMVLEGKDEDISVFLKINEEAKAALKSIDILNQNNMDWNLKNALKANILVEKKTTFGKEQLESQESDPNLRKQHNDNLEGKQAILPSVVDNALNNPSVCFFTGKGKGEKPNLLLSDDKNSNLVKAYKDVLVNSSECVVSLECHFDKWGVISDSLHGILQHNSESANYYKLVHCVVY